MGNNTDTAGKTARTPPQACSANSAVKNGATLLKSYRYDGQGWRISEAPAGGTATDLYYSSQWQVLEERQAGNATAQNVWGMTYVDQLVLRDRDADQDTSHTLEERLYVMQDANFNVTGLTNGNGTVVERYVLDPYGMASVRNADWSVKGDGTVSASGYAWQYLHQGGRFDLTAGLYSFRHRDYSINQQRFIQQDPLISSTALFQMQTRLYERASQTVKNIIFQFSTHKLNGLKASWLLTQYSRSMQPQLLGMASSSPYNLTKNKPNGMLDPSGLLPWVFYYSRPTIPGLEISLGPVRLVCGPACSRSGTTPSTIPYYRSLFHLREFSSFMASAMFFMNTRLPGEFELGCDTAERAFQLHF